MSKNVNQKHLTFFTLMLDYLYYINGGINLTTNFNNNYNPLMKTNSEINNLTNAIESDTILAMRKMTHEFGNALTLINSSLQIIESSHPEVKGFKYWSSTMSDVNYLINLVKEVSYFNNSRKLNLSEINILSLLQSIINTYSGINNSENLYIKLTKINSIPTISGDNTKLRQVFINLIKNSFEALDFNKPSYINISVQAIDHNIIVKIKDNGCGISSDKIDEIFTPMVTFKDGGTGLGLPISKQIIEAHNGTINVSSIEGSGTTFIITLPC